MKSDKKFQNKVLITTLSFFIPVFAIFIGLLAGSYAPFGPKNILTANNRKLFPKYSRRSIRKHAYIRSNDSLL